MTTIRETDTRMLDRELVLENQWLKERVKVLQAETVSLVERIDELVNENHYMYELIQKPSGEAAK